MSLRLLGRVGWDMSADDQTGHRDYHLRTLVECDSASDGPYRAGSCPGLPALGSYWIFGNENDPWAYCHPQLAIRQHIADGEPNYHWIVEQLFSTRPVWRCQDFSPSNPVFEPPRLSGSFVKEYGTTNREFDGTPIMASNGIDFYTVPKAFGQPTVIVEMNSLFLSFPSILAAYNCVNDSQMWGLPARSVLLANVSWNRILYGVCNLYYTTRFEFFTSFNGYDLTGLVDQGNYEKVGGKIRKAEDGLGRPMAGPFLLDGNGRVKTPGANAVFLPSKKIYDQYNFFSLGIPFSL